MQSPERNIKYIMQSNAYLIFCNCIYTKIGRSQNIFSAETKSTTNTLCCFFRFRSIYSVDVYGSGVDTGPFSESYSVE